MIVHFERVGYFLHLLLRKDVFINTFIFICPPKIISLQHLQQEHQLIGGEQKYITLINFNVLAISSAK